LSRPNCTGGSGRPRMMNVLNCIAVDHDLWLVGLSALVCLGGALATLKLFARAAGTAGAQRFGWLILTAVAGGSAIWCTHFVAMPGYKPGVPMSFDPLLTTVSLLVAIIGTGTGFALASSATLGRLAPVTGGTIVGFAISAMHYTGMAAYHVAGLI